MTAHRTPGRPRLKEGEDSSPFTLRLPHSLYDAICQAALRKGIPPRVLIRCVLTQRFVPNSPLIEDQPAQ